jgi:4-alpha-glucanotransferase
LELTRRSGILLHPTCFPSQYGIGDMGYEAYEFLDFLHEAKVKLWQILPLGPTGYGDSPYQCFSAFAGNHLLISPDKLVEEGLLTKNDVIEKPGFYPEKVDYRMVTDWKIPRLEKAFSNFTSHATNAERSKLDRFARDNNHWLNDYAIFMAVKEYHGGKQWDAWEDGISHYEEESLNKWSDKLKEKIDYWKWIQYVFFKQWSDIKYYAQNKGISIIGDLPIFVSYDSSDLWSNPDQFLFSYVAGVPPDYFSETGQLWGNPQYRWERMKEDDYQWWRNRFSQLLKMIDIIRIDHFRGFEATWYIPFGKENAIQGEWVESPGEDFFQTVFKYFGEIPILAENLGVITEEVENLRKKFNMPGMKVLQFAFEDFNPHNGFLPHNYEKNAVAYTGTHDNDTTLGWYNSMSDEVKHYVREYLESSGEQIHWDMIKAIFCSSAHYAIVPLQDFLGLGTEARMNFPSKIGDNWNWRYKREALSDGLKNRLRRLNELYGR